VLAVSPPVVCDPLNDFLPDQAPAVEHVVAFWLDQDRVDSVPTTTVLGLTLSVTTGANSETVTVIDCVAEPPVPVQVSWYSVVLEREPVDQVPLVATAPCQPPAAVHAVALSEFQLKVDVPPLAIVVGDADRVTVGAGEVAMVALLLAAARVAADFAVLVLAVVVVVAGSVRVDWPDDDC
jgi:hypothetical protein